jgi:magnesium transporter
VTVHGPVNPVVDPRMALRETGAVLGRLRAGRLRPASSFDLSYVIVSALARHQEEFVEVLTREVWRLEQRVTGGDLGDPEQFLEEMQGVIDFYRTRTGTYTTLAAERLAATAVQQTTTCAGSPPGSRSSRCRPR